MKNFLISFRYGVSHLYGTFQMAKWEVNVTDDQGNTTKVNYNSTVTVDSNEIENIMFHTPLGMSFTCKDIGDFSLVTKIHYLPSKYNIDLENATIETGHLHFDAFRPTILSSSSDGNASCHPRRPTGSAEPCPTTRRTVAQFSQR